MAVLNIVHGVENILMLAVDRKTVLGAELVQLLNKLVEGDIQHTDVDQHNHGEHFLHDGLRNIEHVSVALEEYAGNAIDNAGGILANNGNDCFFHGSCLLN